MYYHFNIQEQLKNIMNKCMLSDFDREPTAADELWDITDGEIYKKVLASTDGHLFKKYCAFTSTLNTDGAAISKSSNLFSDCYYYPA